MTSDMVDLSEVPWPPHVTNLQENTVEVTNLLNLHATIVGGKRGRPPDIQVLSKGALVLLVACWEAYIEDLAEISFDFLLANADEPTIFPTKVLTSASRHLRESSDERMVWDLAGEGWKKILLKHKQYLFDRYINRLNTPRPSNVDPLFENLIGISRLSKLWKWRGVTNKSALDKLDRLITIRGEIAHRVRTSRTVQRRYVERANSFVNRLAAISSNTLREFLILRTSKEPWIAVSYGDTG